MHISVARSVARQVLARSPSLKDDAHILRALRERLNALHYETLMNMMPGMAACATVEALADWLTHYATPKEQ